MKNEDNLVSEEIKDPKRLVFYNDGTLVITRERHRTRVVEYEEYSEDKDWGGIG